MHIVAIGLNHRTAPIEVRERITVSEQALPEALRTLAARPAVAEAAILSTCNRTEIYSILHQSGGEHLLRSFLAEYRGIPTADVAPYLYIHHDSAAVRHLLRVTSGLDSLVLGEAQILKQVREAFAAATDVGCAGSLLHGLFRTAIETGKRARTETDIGRGGFSIGHAAVDLARSIFGSLEGATVLVLGAGKMSELTAKHLVASGVRLVLVANRTYDRAESLARRLGGSAIHYDEFPETMTRADVVISSTAAPHPIIHREALMPVMRRRRGRPLFLIDIAVPRDVAPDVASLDNVFLYDVDDLEEVVADMARERASEVSRVEAIVDEETSEFVAWWRSLDAVPVVTELRSKYEEIRQSELARLRHQLPEISDRAWQCIEAATRSMLTRIVRDPIQQLKGSAVEDTPDTAYSLLDAARRIFALQNGKDAAGPGVSDEQDESPPNSTCPLPEVVHTTPPASHCAPADWEERDR